MKNLLFLILVVSVFSSFYAETSLKGTWEFRGGIYNGKIDNGTKGYSLQRKYSATTYDTYLLEKGERPKKYESGKYRLKGDTCLETQTFSAQKPSKLLGKTVHYLYQIRHDTLVLRVKLPNGNVEEDYWKKIK
jgi:hypothetical protein